MFGLGFFWIAQESKTSKKVFSFSDAVMPLHLYACSDKRIKWHPVKDDCATETTFDLTDGAKMK